MLRIRGVCEHIAGGGTALPDHCRAAERSAQVADFVYWQHFA
ncbi:hypothetical protein [Nocardia sp. NPDC004604]